MKAPEPGCPPDNKRPHQYTKASIVRAAFLLAGAKEATKKEASVIIKKFLGEEVKE